MTAHAYGCAVKKPKAVLEPRPPAAARLKKINRRQNMTAHAYGCAVIINRRQSKKPPSLRLRGLINKPKAEQETAQPTAARFKNKPKAEQETAQRTAARFKKQHIHALP